MKSIQLYVPYILMKYQLSDSEDVILLKQGKNVLWTCNGWSFTVNPLQM